MTPFPLPAIDFAWLPITPLIVVAVGAITVLMAGVRVRDDESESLGWLALGVTAVAVVMAAGQLGKSGIAFAGAIAIDDFAAYFEIVILIASALTILMSLEYAADAGFSGAEYYSLLLFATLGMMLMAAADDLIVIFIGLEVMSIAVYVLAGIARRSARSTEAALKYFILGAFSTGFLLYGIALVYGATGTIKLGPIRAALSHAMLANPLLLAGLGLLLVGFGFKVAAVPFHMWTPDVYEGAPTPITAFMAVGVKLAAFAGFLRIFMIHLAPAGSEWSWILWVIAALTMFMGNLIALVQRNIKRMLAYSAIAHAGYILVGMTATGAQAGAAILYYLLGYAFTNLGAFAVVVAVERRSGTSDAIIDFRGLARRHPGFAAMMALFLLSLTGVPPLAGFVGKFYLFSAALNAGLVWLVIIAAITSVVSAYYYISVIVAMYMSEGGLEVVSPGGHPALVAVIAIAAIGTVLIGLFPEPYFHAAASAFNSAMTSSLVRIATLR
jgi:NADH-quinone oxidoreductase subunit N